MDRIAVVTGGGSGLGAALCARLVADYVVYSLDRGLTQPEPPSYDGLVYYRCDVRSRDEVRTAVERLALKRLDTLVHCAGINAIDWLPDVAEADWDQVMDTNAKAVWLVTQALLPALIEARGTICVITSSASQVPMTASLAYNASKAAAHMMVRQLARELTSRYGITVFGVAPNKLRGTAMSCYIERRVVEVRGWTPEYAAQYQQQALLGGEETDPEVLAEYLAFLLSTRRRHQYLSGCVMPYGI